MFQGTPPMPPAPGSLVPKIVQISDLKKRRFLCQNGSPLGAHWGAKISKICQKCLPRAPLGPLPKNVSKYVAFLTLQTLENQAPAWAGAQFSLCGPTPKKSSKWSPKTSLWGNPWSLKRPQCGKLGHLKIHSKINSDKYPKMLKIGLQMGVSFFIFFMVLGIFLGTGFQNGSWRLKNCKITPK